MKKIFMISLILTLVSVGCSNLSQTSNENHQASKVSRFTEASALKMAINHYNKDDKGEMDYIFNSSITVGNTVSKEVPLGGLVGRKTKLDMKNSVKPSGKDFIVTLTEDYNYVVNGTKAISYWKYAVSSDGIKLLDKNQDGIIMNEIK